MKNGYRASKSRILLSKVGSDPQKLGFNWFNHLTWNLLPSETIKHGGFYHQKLGFNFKHKKMRLNSNKENMIIIYNGWTKHLIKPPILGELPIDMWIPLYTVLRDTQNIYEHLTNKWNGNKIPNLSQFQVFFNFKT